LDYLVKGEDATYQTRVIEDMKAALPELEADETKTNKDTE
jgi:hypothetical protein